MRYALCNEMFGAQPLSSVCEVAGRLGYSGLELAPFTLAPLVTDLSQAQRRELRTTVTSAGLEIVGLHWLLAKTTGFHLVSRDPAVQRATTDYLSELARCTADLGGELMVFGSPTARQRPDNMTLEEADDRACQTLQGLLPILDETCITLCLEPLGPTETNYMNTAADAVRLMQRLGHERIRLHLDVKAMTSETDSPAALIKQFAAETRHFHANDPNLLGPGMGAVDFGPIAAALVETGYQGWVSVEVFDFTPGAETIAATSIATMKHAFATGEGLSHTARHDQP